MGWNATTKNGYNYYEVASALQKSIRRCNEDETVFWGIELFESDLMGHLWNRLFIIASEDIGLAEDGFIVKFMGMKKSYDYLEIHRPKNLSKRLVLLQILIMFARAKKSRYVDLAYCVYWAKHAERAKTRKIPDYAFDMHTQKGKRMGRGLDHFYNEGAKTNNNPYIEGEKEFEILAKKLDIEESAKPKVATKPKEKPKPGVDTLF